MCHCTLCITPKRVSSLRDPTLSRCACWQHWSFWNIAAGRAIGSTVLDLTGTRFKTQITRSGGELVSTRPSVQLCLNYRRLCCRRVIEIAVMQKNIQMKLKKLNAATGISVLCLFFVFFQALVSELVISVKRRILRLVKF